MRLFLFLLFVSFSSGSSESSEETASTEISNTANHPGTYLITAPKVIRPGLPYAVSVNILRSSREKHTVLVEIRTDSNETVISHKVKGVKKRIPQVITLPKGAENELTASQKYKIYVRGETEKGVMLFEEEKPLSLRLKSTSTFVQTDKGIYKPGQIVWAPPFLASKFWVSSPFKHLYLFTNPFIGGSC